MHFLRKQQQIVQVSDFQEDCNSQREISITANSHDVPLYGAGPSLKQAIVDHHHIPLGLTIDVKSQINLFGGIVRKYFLTTIACDVLFNPDTGAVAATYCEPPKLQDGSTISHLLRGKTTLKGKWKKSMESKLSYYPTNQLLMYDHLPQKSGESNTHRARAYLSIPYIIWGQCFIPPPWYKCDSYQKPPHQATGLHLAIYTLQKVSKHTRLYHQQEWCRNSCFLIVTQD